MATRQPKASAGGPGRRAAPRAPAAALPDTGGNILSVVHDAAARILSAGDWRGNVERMLAEIGAAIGVSRVVLSRNEIDPDGHYLQEDLFEWDAPGVVRLLGNPELPTLAIKDDAFQDWRERRSRGEVVQGITRDLPEDMRRWFRVQGIRSAMRVPVFVGAEWWGSIGFDQCDRDRQWTAVEVESLRTAAALVGIGVEHDRSRQALLASEAEAARKAMFLEAVLDGTAQGVNAVDADLSLQFANERFLELFGFPPELGRPGTPFAELLRHRWRSGATARGSQATDEESYIAEQMAHWRTMPAHQREVRIEEERSHGRIVDVWRRPLPDGGFVTTFTDMTEQLRMRDALRASEAEAGRKAAFLEGILESVAQGVNVVDANLTFQQANARYPEMYGFPPELCRAGTPVTELIRYRWRSGAPAAGTTAQDEDAYVAEQLARWRRSFARNPTLRAEETRPDGRVFDVQRRPLRDGGFVTTVTDITERKRAEQEIARQREALHQSEKLTALGSLLAGVAHELNNPLSVVVSQALLMQETAADSRTATRAAKIQAAADRCSRIVKSFLAIARQRPAARAAVRLRSLLQTALDLTTYGLSSSGVAVELDVPGDLPEIWADPDQLVQVFMNLIVNAQQVLQEVPGSRRLRIAARPDGPAHVRVSIADNGPGVPAEIRSRIFDPFFTTKPVGSGTGMGLSLCLGMIGAHKGTIAVEDTPSGGATFVVTLPHGSPADLPAEPAPVTPARVEKKILIVDDEPEIAEMLAEIAAPLADRVDVAGNGAEALRRLMDTDYDLVISDLRMPELDGPGLYRSLRRRPGGFSGLILFVSGDTLGHNLDLFLKESGCPFLEKPFTPAEVRRRVAEMLENAPG